MKFPKTKRKAEKKFPQYNLIQIRLTYKKLINISI